MGSDMAFELFSHVTRFLGRKVVLLGLYNGQRLEGEPAEDLVSYSRVDEVSAGHAGAEGWRWGVAGLRIAALQSNPHHIKKLCRGHQAWGRHQHLPPGGAHIQQCQPAEQGDHTWLAHCRLPAWMVLPWQR